MLWRVEEKQVWDRFHIVLYCTTLGGAIYRCCIVALCFTPTRFLQMKANVLFGVGQDHV